jgi:hypothetical protein
MPTQPFQCDKSYCFTTVFRSMIECGFESFSIMACPSSSEKLLIIRSKRGTQPLVSIYLMTNYRRYRHVVFVTLKGLAMPTLQNYFHAPDIPLALYWACIRSLLVTPSDQMHKLIDRFLVSFQIIKPP